MLLMAVKKAPDDLVLDIGANHGLFSIFAVANGSTRVVTVEPQAQLCEHITESIGINGMGDKIALYNNAVLDKRTKVTNPTNTHEHA